MKKLLAFIIFLLFLLLVWFSWNWYKDNVICCGEVEKVVQLEYGPLIFECDTENIITNNKWAAKRKEILDARKPGQKLLITTPNFDGEGNKYSLVRAAKISVLFKPELSADDISFNFRQGGNCEKTKTNLMHESRYQWFTETGNVIKYHDHTSILYEYDSTTEVKDKDVEAYFDELAEDIKSSGKSVTITGNTDSSGEEAYNMELGLKRAKEFETHLLNRGVPANQINIESKGETMPVTTNSTPEGRKQNRRVEIKINN